MEQPPSPQPPRRRRRAVGPVGARPGEPTGDWLSPDEQPAPSPDDDARLLADVPPHHGPV